MKQLLVSDQVKRVLHANARGYVELNYMKGWLNPQDVAELAVKYEKKYVVESVTQGSAANEGRSGKGKNSPKSLNTGSGLSGSGGMKCFFCNGTGHVKAQCPKREEQGSKGDVARILSCEQVSEPDGLSPARKITKTHKWNQEYDVLS